MGLESNTSGIPVPDLVDIVGIAVVVDAPAEAVVVASTVAAVVAVAVAVVVFDFVAAAAAAAAIAVVAVVAVVAGAAGAAVVVYVVFAVSVYVAVVVADAVVFVDVADMWHIPVDRVGTNVPVAVVDMLVVGRIGVPTQCYLWQLFAAFVSGDSPVRLIGYRYRRTRILPPKRTSSGCFAAVTGRPRVHQIVVGVFVRAALAVAVEVMRCYNTTDIVDRGDFD